MGTHACVPSCVRPDVSLRHFFFFFFRILCTLCFFKTGFSWARYLLIWLGWLAREPKGSSLCLLNVSIVP